ncbi:hypothetical protein Pmani_025053 [Petrolisthes manimaculis]|uniref:Cytochrome b5 heme-binding domain-containing protein n=1 Tax=Petrolisthes manimaculis TaxID=1843537 RepID=A0AAE1P6B0_9EUCA|nr:hypothetical protein Pmani_025053 [Petrolisthes manimaculis]
MYDLTHFVDIHPGGKDWIRSTRGTDITELFECYHITDKPYALLQRYHVKDVTTPRNSPYTFHTDGFYNTFKRKIQPILKEIGRGPTNTILLLQDGFVMTYVLLTLAATLTHSYTLAVLAGLLLCLTMIGAHNFFHQRDNFRMYYFDLSLLSSYDWRITHGISHHVYPNTIYDHEIALLEPFFRFLPSPYKSLVLRYGSWVYEQPLFLVVLMLEGLKRLLGLLLGWGKLRPENFLPFLQFLLMAILTPSILVALKYVTFIIITLYY